MIVRHRVPVIFNLSMVDVLCCALGCVILLWLINFYDAKLKSNQANKTRQLLDTTNSELDELNEKLARYRQQLTGSEEERKKYVDLYTLVTAKNQSLLNDLTIKTKAQQDLMAKLNASGKQIVLLQAQLAEKNTMLADANQNAKDLETKLQASGKQIVLLQGKLADNTKEILQLNAELLAGSKETDDWKTKLSLANKQLVDLNDKLKNNNQQVTKLSNQLTDSQKLVDGLEKLVSKLQTDSLADSKKLLATRDNALLLRKRLDLAQAEIEERQSSMEKLDRQLAALGKEKNLLTEQLNQAQESLLRNNKALSYLSTKNKELQGRFAGVDLTGQKVIFLVDISGSMTRRDLNTLDNAKWPKVCRTLGHIMRSLPNLTHYQIIAFSDKSYYPLDPQLGNGIRWREYDEQRSVEDVIATMEKIEPAGYTVMLPAFETAFRYRTIGLDTIYLISDGIPQISEEEGLQQYRLKGVELSTFLSNRLRNRIKNDLNSRNLINNQGKPPVTIHTIGFFFDSPELGSFLWALARENGGNFVGMSRLD